MLRAFPWPRLLSRAGRSSLPPLPGPKLRTGLRQPLQLPSPLRSSLRAWPVLLPCSRRPPSGSSRRATSHPQLSPSQWLLQGRAEPGASRRRAPSAHPTGHSLLAAQGRDSGLSWSWSHPWSLARVWAGTGALGFGSEWACAGQAAALAGRGSDLFHSRANSQQLAQTHISETLPGGEPSSQGQLPVPGEPAAGAHLSVQEEA